MNSSAISASVQDPPLSLDNLAEEIRGHHSAILGSYHSAVEHARDAGRALIVAKGAVPHGEFGPWVDGHCDCGYRQARVYMQIADGWPAIESKMAALLPKSTGSALTIREALRLLSADDAPDDVANPMNLHQWPDSCRRDVLRRWFNLRAAWFAILAAEGRTTSEIGELFGFSDEEVEDLRRRLTQPTIPDYSRLGVETAELLGAEVDRSLRGAIAQVWESAASTAGFAGVERQTIKKLEAIGEFLRSGVPSGASPLLFSRNPPAAAAWCLANTEVNIILGIESDDRSLEERWQDVEAACFQSKN